MIVHFCYIMIFINSNRLSCTEESVWEYFSFKFWMNCSSSCSVFKRLFITSEQIQTFKESKTNELLWCIPGIACECVLSWQSSGFLYVLVPHAQGRILKIACCLCTETRFTWTLHECNPERLLDWKCAETTYLWWKLKSERSSEY